MNKINAKSKVSENIRLTKGIISIPNMSQLSDLLCISCKITALLPSRLPVCMNVGYNTFQRPHNLLCKNDI